MSENRQLSTRSERPLREVNLDEVARNVATVTDDDMYEVAGKKGVGARVARHIAAEQDIDTELLDIGKNADQAWAKVKATHPGTEDSRPVSRTRAVIIRYADELRLSLFDAIEKGVSIPYWDSQSRSRKIEKRYLEYGKTWEFDESGFPRILDPEAMMYLMKTHLREIVFAERKALSMAERNAILAVVGKPEEDQPEKEEEKAPGKPSTISAASPSANELRSSLVRTIMEHCGKNIELAKQMFYDLTVSLADQGVPTTNDSKQVTDVKHLDLMTKALAQLISDQQSIPAEGEVQEEGLFDDDLSA